jgi:hypothetical protein
MQPVRLVLLVATMALGCRGETTSDKIGSGPDDSGLQAMDVDWGSWKISATAGFESEACSDMGASAGDMTLYAEVEVAEPDFIGVQLGSRYLSGARASDGFAAGGEELLPPANTDGMGIFINLDAPDASLRAFTGELVYDIVSSRGHCTIALNTVGEWMYYEPPPPCTG